MENKLPEEVKALGITFADNNYKLYLVGGAVRDLILGKEIKDWDFTTDATPEQILKILPEGFYNNSFGTVGINSSLGILEVTTMRKEDEYTDFRHPAKIEWTTNIDEDLKRRDFTINAMAMQVNDIHQIIDPFNGQLDLQNKTIRAVGDAKKRFHEDALRLIRAVRFAAQLDFQIEENTAKAIKECADFLNQISWERIRDELLKTLASEHPYEGIVLLRETGLLKYILPEVEECFGIVQEGPRHDRVYDIGEHSLLSLKHCPSPDPIVRLATLIHDVGKKDTIQIQEDGNVTFYGHDVVGARVAANIANRLKLSKKEIRKIISLVRWHMFTLDENQTDSAIRRFIKNVGEENIDDMMALRVGDRLGGGTQKAVSWRMKKYRERIDEVLHKPFSVTDLKVNGQDVMEILSIPPSRKVGEILDELFKEVLEDASKNDREYLIEKIKSFS